jgi:hypothetical protein
LQVALVEKKAGSPTNLLFTDRFLQFCIVSWLVFFGVIVYRAR